MIAKQRLLWGVTGCIAAAGLGIAVYALQSHDTINALGLTASDLAAGGFPDVEAIRAQTKVIADSYLAEHATKLTEMCGGPYRLAFDDSSSPKTAFGLRSTITAGTSISHILSNPKPADHTLSWSSFPMQRRETTMIPASFAFCEPS